MGCEGFSCEDKVLILLLHKHAAALRLVALSLTVVGFLFCGVVNSKGSLQLLLCAARTTEQLSEVSMKLISEKIKKKMRYAFAFGKDCCLLQLLRNTTSLCCHNLNLKSMQHHRRRSKKK